MTGRCEGCGQPRLIETVAGLCGFCAERKPETQPETDRLFEPAPAPMPGQADLFDPDRGER